MQEKITKPALGTTCHREVRLDPAGVPVYCPSKAIMVIRDVPLCMPHAVERMQAIEAMKTPIAPSEISRVETSEVAGS